MKKKLRMRFIYMLSAISILSLYACKQKSEPAEQSLVADTPDHITVDGSELKYVVEGDGIPCLVIGSSVYYPKTFSDNIRRHLKMYFVDMKWFAEVYTPENLNSVTIQTIVEDVEEIRKELGLNNPLVMGHSIHGTIAMEYAKQFADKVAGVVVIGSPAKFGNEEYTQKAEALWATASEERKAIQEENWGKIKEIDRLTGKDATAAEYNRASPQYWYDPHYDANWLWDGMTVHTEVTDNLFSRVFSDYDMFREPVSLRVPVLVVMGIYDYVIPYTLWETEYESMDDYTFVLFEKSGHTPQLEEQENFDTMLINWLNEKISTEAN